MRLAYRHVLKNRNLRKNAKKVMIVMTDGESNTDRQLTHYQGSGARSHGVNMFSIGIGERIDINVMREIASRPYYYFVRILDDYGALMRHSVHLIHDILVGESYKLSCYC